VDTPDLRGTDGHSPARLLDLAERIDRDGWQAELVDEIERAGAEVHVSAGNGLLDLKHVDGMLFTVQVHVPGRRAETIIDREIGPAVSHGLRCCVSKPVIVDGRPLQP
jgi:hypothetical protein